MNVHHLLPWYVNETLDGPERRRFAEHLPGCGRCRAEIEIVEKLGDELDSNPYLLSDHPAPEAILLAVDPDRADIETDPDSVQAVLRHLSVCDACTRESGWLQGAASAVPDTGAEWAPTPAERTAVRTPGWPAWLGLAAAVLIAAVVLPFILAPPAGEPTGLVTAEVVRSIARGDEPPAIGVAPDASRVQLLFEVDLGAGDYPARVEVTGAAGAGVFAGPLEGPEDLLQGLFVVFSCARSDCADGDYVARVISADPDRAPTELRFRLTTEPGSST